MSILRPARRAPRAGPDVDPAPGSGRPSWLCPTQADRTRLLEMGARVRPIRTGGSALLGVVLVAAASQLGWWTIAVYLPPVVFLWLIDVMMRRSARPENAVVVASLWSTLTIGAGAAVTGGLTSPILGWLIIPALLLATRFRLVVVVVGSGVAVVVASAAGAVASLLPASPPAPGWVGFLCFCALLVNVTGVSSAMLGAELTSRAHAAVDPLTGLANRLALADRFADLERRPPGAGPISVLLVDIDHFKRVNDAHGHDVGDEVLIAVAEVLRVASPGSAPVYRLGGEEFLVVLEGSGSPEAGEGLRGAVEALRPRGLLVTVSVGCAESAGDDVSQRDLLRRADQALYRAKSAGRNRVVPGPLATAA